MPVPEEDLPSPGRWAAGGLDFSLTDGNTEVPAQSHTVVGIGDRCPESATNKEAEDGEASREGCPWPHLGLWAWVLRFQH